MVPGRAWAITGEACLERYDSLIHRKLYVPGTEVCEILGDLKYCLTSADDYRVRVASLVIQGWAIPWRLMKEVRQSLQASLELKQKKIDQSDYSGTFALMMALNQLNKEIAFYDPQIFQEQNQFWFAMISIDWKGYRYYQDLIQSDSFQSIAQDQRVSLEEVDPLVKRLLYELNFGNLFCGKTDEFEPITLKQLGKKSLLTRVGRS